MITAIQPRTNFPISRIIPDPSDVTAYYIQAVIRNGATNAIIDTVNLTSIGSNIYSKTWLTPADPSGLGLYVNITTSVYTDSGYTTKSTTYGDSIDTFLIYAFQGAGQAGGSGMGAYGSADIDYKRIEKIISKLLEEKIAELKKAMPKDHGPYPEMPDMPEFDQGEVIAALKQIGASLSKLEKKPEYKETDLSAVIRAIGDAGDRLEGRIGKIPRPDPVDLAPLMKELGALDIEGKIRKVLGDYASLSKDLPGVLMTLIAESLKGKQEMKQEPLPSPYRPPYHN